MTHNQYYRLQRIFDNWLLKDKLPKELQTETQCYDFRRMYDSYMKHEYYLTKDSAVANFCRKYDIPIVRTSDGWRLDYVKPLTQEN